MRKIRTLRWLDSIKSWSGKTPSDLVYRLWMPVLIDPLCTHYSTDNFDLSAFHAFGIIIVDLDPVMTEGASPVHGFAIDGCRVSATLRYHKNTAGVDGT